MQLKSIFCIQWSLLYLYVMIDTFWTNYKNISNIKIYFYPRSFRILAFIFTSVIHFEFNFNVYFEVRVDIFLFIDISNWSTTIYWENSPLATELFCLNYYLWNQMTIYAWSTFEPLILFHWSICVSFHKYHCLDYCKIVGNLGTYVFQFCSFINLFWLFKVIYISL